MRKEDKMTKSSVVDGGAGATASRLGYRMTNSPDCSASIAGRSSGKLPKE